MSEFKYNKDVEYAVGVVGEPKTITTNSLVVAVNQVNSFQVKVSNPLDRYLNPPIINNRIANMWFSHPLQFYQNQLNFAVYCATTGCGVSYVDHLNHPNLLVRSVYRFHFYYQFRRILSELQVPLPHDNSFNHFNNRMDMRAFERICNEFNIMCRADFRQKLDRNHGMGTLYLWGTHRVYNFDYWREHTSFEPGAAVRLGSIEQQHENAWSTFILDKSKGLTMAGVERINDSIRTYVWCLLGSQAQTRSDVMDQSTGFDAQKQYLANLEDAINSVVDLPSSIQRYQDVLRYARSKVDFAVGGGLYMLPSDLGLQVGTITNYNNKILVAGNDQKLGKNEHINSEPAIIQSMPQSRVQSMPQSRVQSMVQNRIPSRDHPDLKPIKSYDSHEAEKVALVFGLTFLGLGFLYLTKKKSSD